jgi:hypothetical protein
MKNRAKCKLCNSVIESFHQFDYVVCTCGEIALDGGEAMKCYAKDFSNFLRVDDQGNEIVVKVQETIDVIPNEKPTKKDLLVMLDEMIKSYERLPSHAMSNPISHYDFCGALILIQSILTSD